MGRSIAIIGGGLAGLSCAIGLQELGIPYTLFEASDTLGGRVSSYTRKQLIVDRGFQVFLPHYKLSRQLLDLPKLDLCYYPSGANIATPSGMQWFGHQYPKKYKNGPKLNAKLMDYIQLGMDVLKGISKPHSTTIECQDHFRDRYSTYFSDHFLTPFFRGVFLDPDCIKGVDQFQYYLHCFFRKGAAIPAKGMAEIPKQLEAKIPSECIQKNATITAIQNNTCVINDTPMTFDHIVLATDFSTSFKLLKLPEPEQSWNHVHNYILAKKTETRLAPLILNAKKGNISHINIPTLISSKLAPENTHYMNASSFVEADPKNIETEVHNLTGEKDWVFVWHDTIKKALPRYKLTLKIQIPMSP